MFPYAPYEASENDIKKHLVSGDPPPIARLCAEGTLEGILLAGVARRHFSQTK